MLSAALLLLCNSLFLSLHLSGSAGSFPKPLPPEKERECLERCAAGDLPLDAVCDDSELRHRGCAESRTAGDRRYWSEDGLCGRRLGR